MACNKVWFRNRNVFLDGKVFVICNKILLEDTTYNLFPSAWSTKQIEKRHINQRWVLERGRSIIKKY